MLVSDPNNIKIYNLSGNKSFPEWISNQQKRELEKKNSDFLKRIELIQDFDMPGVSTSIKVTSDGNYILATGIYKPRVRCYDVNNLSMKFERCFDSEILTFQILSEDYRKLVFLHSDRYVVFHYAPGHYYKLRVPRFGRDMKYNPACCDLYVVGASSEVYRLNLEQGQFLTPFVTEASGINRCDVNPVHQLLVCGTEEGKVEAWDPRTRRRVGVLDCAMNITDTELEGFPSISALKFNGGLTLGVGTATGHVLLYDIRSNKPFVIKDHMYGQPIQDIEFQEYQDLVLSLDASVIRIWEQRTGKLFTSIEGAAPFNGLCLVPNTGMMFAAVEDTKIQTYYIPSMGPAPRWCSFLDNLTEELEESHADAVYDDYKFVTKKELEELGLDHLLGTNLLKAYMHGYFIDVRLYRKAKSLAEPFEFDRYKKKKIREKIEESRTNRVQLQALPKVNKDLALKLMNDNMQRKKSKKEGDLLIDDRFKSMFENPDFEIDKNAEQYRLLHPVLSRLDRNAKKDMLNKLKNEQFEEVAMEDNDETQETSSDSDSSSDDDRMFSNELKHQHRLLKREPWQKDDEEEEDEIEERRRREERADNMSSVQPKFYELKEGEDYKILKRNARSNKASLGDRVKQEGTNTTRTVGFTGRREMTFTVGKDKSYHRQRNNFLKHRAERKKLHRPVRNLPRFRSK